MLKYWNDKEKTEETITEDRWLRTGDVATIDENGYGQIVGRIKDMLIRGGENVYPREVEDILHTHPAVIEAHVKRHRQYAHTISKARDLNNN